MTDDERDARFIFAGCVGFVFALIAAVAVAGSL